MESRGETCQGGALKCKCRAEGLVPSASEGQNAFMRALATVLVAAGLLFAVYELYLKYMPSSDTGTAPTQAISLTGVRSDLLQIAQAERANIALNGNCVSLDELNSSGAMTLKRKGRDGYTYQVNCSGAEFQVIAQHPAAPEGSPIRYPVLAINSMMEIHEIAPN